MNPYTGQTTPVDLSLAGDKLLWREERQRAADEVGLDDPDDLVLVAGRPEHVRATSEAVKAVKAREKSRRRAANKRARKQRKANR